MERLTYGVYREDARSDEGLLVVPAFVQVSADFSVRTYLIVRLFFEIYL